MRKHSISRTIFEPVDEWLENLSLFRKQVPRDASCLFRAVAEQVCFSQSYHERIRHLALDYMLLYKNYFQMYLNEPLENYVKKMRSAMEFGGQMEMIALSLIFRTDCLVFTEIDSPPANVTGFGFQSLLMLYQSGIHYDIVYKKNYTSVAGFCQALVYEMLYVTVFGMKEVMTVVDQMLHDLNSSFRKDSVNSEGQEIDILRIVKQVEAVKTSTNILNDSFEYGTPDKGIIAPFPYRVAKALDPDIYRNCEYDIWITLKREAKFGPYDHKGLQIGVKVVINPAAVGFPSNSCKVLHGHIQSMTENQGPVEVFVEELGQRMKVPYACLEKVPPTLTRPSLEEGSRFLAGSPLSYRVLSALTRRAPPLPLPEGHLSPPALKGRKKTAAHFPSRVQPSKEKSVSVSFFSIVSKLVAGGGPFQVVSLEQLFKVQREAKTEQSRSTYMQGSRGMTPSFVKQSLLFPVEPEPSSLFQNCDGPRNWIPAEDVAQLFSAETPLHGGGIGAPCMNVECSGECGGAVIVCATVPDMFGYPVDGGYSTVMPYMPPFFVYGGSHSVNELPQPLPTSLSCFPMGENDPYQVAFPSQFPTMYSSADATMYYHPLPLTNSAHSTLVGNYI